MNSLISYYDIPVIILVIYLAVLHWKKQNMYYKEREEEIEFNESRGISNSLESNSLRISDKYTKTLLLLIIVCGIIAIYNRINGNMPNIFFILKSLIMRKIRSYS
jgi:hypothetical protein